MPKHIKPHDNNNCPIVDIHDEMLPLCYFNHVKLTKGQSFSYQLAAYESVIVMVRGTSQIEAGSDVYGDVGKRESLWEGKPDSVYVPLNTPANIRCESPTCELFIAGGQTTEQHKSFQVSPEDVEVIQYGSDDTKTHRKIMHILGHNAEGKVGRILVSELFTVGAGGWSGFPPHKHDEERPPLETRFEELYQFRFRPEHGFGAQFVYPNDDSFGPVYHIKNGSTILIDEGYHPSVAAPGYEMYYFTLIVGEHTRSLLQYFHPDHEYQVHTIPGIKDMIAGFK